MGSVNRRNNLVLRRDMPQVSTDRTEVLGSRLLRFDRSPSLLLSSRKYAGGQPALIVLFRFGTLRFGWLSLILFGRARAQRFF